jgi:hypothetical protein
MINKGTYANDGLIEGSPDKDLMPINRNCLNISASQAKKLGDNFLDELNRKGIL